MTMYELLHADEIEPFDVVDAKSPEHAVAIYSAKLDMELTLEKGAAAPEFMMRRIEGNTVGWGAKHDIPVWVK